MDATGLVFVSETFIISAILATMKLDPWGDFVLIDPGSEKIMETRPLRPDTPMFTIQKKE